MRLSELCEKLNILECNANMDMTIEGICCDSRNAKENFIFVVVQGLSTDGNRFIPSAFQNGAVVAVCEKRPEQDIPYILVNNARNALALLCCAFNGYPTEKMRVIGVTGTSGKTTTTNLIKHILETQTNAKVGLVGTNGNMIGHRLIHTEFTTPDSTELQNLFKEMVDEDCQYAVMEVSSHGIYMNRVDGIHFSTAAFTNLSQDHLDLHKTMDEYASVKRRLFTRCDTACINLDDNYSQFMLEGVNSKLITTSVDDKSATIYAENIKLSTDSVQFDAVYQNTRTDVKLPIPGLFSVYNALTAISVCMSEGISIEKCAAGLATASGVKGRVEHVPTDGNYSIIIDYSHKPDALEKVLKTLRVVTKGKLICLFGCGGDRDRDKRPKMGRIAAENSDLVIITSDNPRTEKPMDIIYDILPGMKDTNNAFIVESDRIKAIHTAIDIAKDGDVILLAGKGHEDYQVIGHEKIHMDEREIVADYLIARKNQ